MVEKKENVNIEVNMVSAVNHALSYKKKNPKADEESIMKQVSKFVRAHNNENNKLAMIAAASKAIKISEQSPFLNDKEIIKHVMVDLGDIWDKVDKK